MFHLEIGKEPVNVSPAGTALPYTHELHGVKTITGQAFQLSLEHVTQTDRATSAVVWCLSSVESRKVMPPIVLKSRAAGID
jgi:hypothetical protein